MKIILSLLAFVAVSVVSGSAQDIVREKPSLSRAMQLFKERNASPDYLVNGWRVLLIATRDRRKVDRANARFRQISTGTEAEMIFVDPYYKLLYGAYRTKLEAMSALADLRSDFPGAFEVRDKVTQEELYNSLVARFEK